jgi:anti-sigma factor RsiW
VSTETRHPAAAALEAFAAEELAAGDRVVVESHLVGCDVCRAATEEWRSLFALLAELPRHAPASGFADRVMAGVAVPVPLPQRVRVWAGQTGQALERLLPTTTRGWAFACALLALPVLLVGGVLAWLLSRSYVTGHDLWIFVTQNLGAAATSAGGWAFQRIMASDVTVWLLRVASDVFEAQGAGGIGAAAVLLGVGMAVSIWVLYTNLFRTPTRESNYVTYSF